jgi:hypothetical protein
MHGDTKDGSRFTHDTEGSGVAWVLSLGGPGRCEMSFDLFIFMEW